MFQYIGEYKDGLNKAYTGTVDINGNIYISDTSNNRIVKLNSNMEYVSQYTGLKSPRGISVDNNGNIYIADSLNHRVVKLNSNMEYISQFGTTGVIKTDNTGLNIPCGLDIDSNGDIYIIEYGNERLIKLNSNMEYVSQFTGLYGPYDVCIDDNGNIYIADMRNDRLVKLNSNMEYVSQFGFTDSTRSDHTGLYGPSGVCIDSNGNIYISDIYNNRVVKLNSNMEYVSQYRDGIANPQGIFIDNNDNIYIADYDHNRIMIIKHIAQYEKQFGTTGVVGANNYNLNTPYGVDIDNNGNTYIADYNNHRLVKLDPNMQYISQFGATGVIKTDNAGLNNPYGVSIDNIGNIYIGDYGNNRLVKLNSNMEYVSQFTGLSAPCGVSIDNMNNIYIADYNNNRIIKLNYNMEYVSQFTELNNPCGVSIDSNYNIYIADYNNHRVVKLDPNMQYISQFGITGTYKTDSTGLRNPSGVSIDDNDNIYISDYNNNRLVKLNSNMEYITQFGNTGTYIQNKLLKPVGLSIDNSGNIYIADSGNHRVVKLTNLLFQILCKIMQYINTPSLLDINISEQVDTFRILLNDQEKILLNNVSSYKYNLDKIWNELLLENNVVIETNKGNKSLSINKPTIPETLLYNNIFTNKDILVEYNINPSYDNTNTPLSYTYKISLDSEILFTHDELTNQQIVSSITISYNKLVKQKYSFITDRNLVITKLNSNGETISYNIPIRIDPKKLFSKYFNGLSNYISINNWVKPLSELTIQVVKKSSTDSEFVVSTDNSLISLTNNILKIGGVSTFTGNIYEIRIWEKGFEQPYTYDQLKGDEDKLYVLYRLNEYNSNNIYDSCGELHGKFIGNLINQEVVPEGVSYLTLPVINSENEIVKQHQDHSYEYKIESPRSCFFNSIENHNVLIDTDHVELTISNNIIDINKLLINKLSFITPFEQNVKVNSSLSSPENGWKRINDNDPNIQYPSSATYTSASSVYYNSDVTIIKIGITIINFIGSRFRLISYKSPTQGIINIDADGNITNNINLYSSSTPARVLVYEKIFDKYGKHTIIINNTTNMFQLDAIDIDDNGYLI